MAVRSSEPPLTLRVILIGPRACGKTSVGQALRTRLGGWTLVDLDREYDLRHRTRPSADLLDSLTHYYTEQQKLLLEYLQKPRLILALSGGVLVNRMRPLGNADVLRACHHLGKMVLVLPSRFDWRNKRILYERERSRDYDLPKHALSQLQHTCEQSYDERIRFFRANADLTVYGNQPDALARKIIQAYRLPAV